MNKSINTFFFFILGLYGGAHAQLFNRTTEGPPIYDYARRLGPMQDRPLADIIDSFKAQHYNQVQLSYAIYAWVAQNIAFDHKAFRNPEKSNHTASVTLKKRSGSSEGYSNVFKALCDVAGIQCYTIEGVAKAYPAEINSPDDLEKHYWNIVRIKNMLLFIDVTWGAGETDEKGKNFIKEYRDPWFFTNKEIFLMSHFTKDKNNPIPADRLPSKAEFVRGPVVYKDAVPLQIYPAATVKGKLRSRINKTKTLDFELRNEEVPIRSVSVVMRGKEVVLPIKMYENVLVVDIPFTEKGEYPVVLKVNDAKVYGFMASVSGGR